MKNRVLKLIDYLISQKDNVGFDLGYLIQQLGLSSTSYFYGGGYQLSFEEFLNMDLLSMKRNFVEIFIKNGSIINTYSGEQLCAILSMINYNDFLSFESHKKTFLAKIEAYVKHQMINIIQDLNDDDLLFIQQELKKEMEK